jgi:hypothetical protein
VTAVSRAFPYAASGGDAYFWLEPVAAARGVAMLSGAGLVVLGGGLLGHRVIGTSLRLNKMGVKVR